MSYHIQPDGRIQADGITLYTTAGGINHSLMEVHPSDVTDVSQSVSATLGPLLAHTQLQNLAVTGGPTGVVVPSRTSLPPLSISLPVGTNQRPSGTTDDTNNDSPPKKKPQILEKMKELRDQGKYCDVTIDVKGVRFRAHKNVLAAWSPYFDLHLSEVFGQRDLLIVHYDNYEVFSDLLDFLYTGRIAPRETNFLQLLHLAVSFQIELLQNDCEEYLRSNLHLGNFTTTYFLSRKYRIHSLEKFVVGFLQMNLSDAVKQNEFLSLTFGQFHSLLSGNCMEQVKPEIKLFLIISWVGFEVRKRERYLVMLLKHIDWTTVASDFLLEISRTENFFTTHESSLYLLLQTLFSSSISLGPYIELFPALRLTYSHILNDIVDSTGSIPPKGDDYCPVTVTASCNITNKTDCSVNTDVTGPDIEAAMPDNYPLVHEDAGRMTMRMTMTRELENNYADRGYYDEDNNNDSYVNESSNVTSTVENNKEENIGVKRKTKCKKIKLIMPVPPQEKKHVENKKNTKKQSLRRSNRKRIKRRHFEYDDNIEAEEEEGQIQEIDDTEKSPHEDEQPNNNENIEKDVDENIDDEEMERGSSNAIDDEEDEEEEEDADDDDVTPQEFNQNKASGQTGHGEKNGSKNSPTRKRTKKKPDDDQMYHCTHKNCKYATTKKSTLRKHYDREHIITEYMCNICNLKLEYTREYKKHMRKHFDGPPFFCDYPGCNYQNETFMPMISHRMRHTDDRPFKCDQCNMSFRTRNNLTQHKAIHTEKSIPCPVCKKLFLLKNTMEQHLVTHSDDRPYLCDLCGFSTKYQSHLATHKRRHTGDVFPCTFPNCTYTTPKKCQLKSHMRFHFQIRNYHCETCGRAFIEKSHLNRHIRSHNVVELEMCPFCPYKTTRKDKMKEHYKRYHGDNPTAKGPYRVRKSRSSNKGEATQFHVLPESCKFDHAYTMQPPLQLDPSTAANRIFQEIQGQQLVMSPGQNLPVGQLTVATVTLPVSLAQNLRDAADIHSRLVTTSTPGSVSDTTLVNSPITPTHDDITPGSDVHEDPDARTVLHETNNPRSLLQSLDHHRSVIQDSGDHQTVLQEDDHQSYVQQVHMPQSSSGPVTLSQAIVNQAFTSQANQQQQGQNPDYGGLNAFMALF